MTDESPLTTRTMLMGGHWLLDLRKKKKPLYVCLSMKKKFKKCFKTCDVRAAGHFYILFCHFFKFLSCRI